MTDRRESVILVSRHGRPSRLERIPEARQRNLSGLFALVPLMRSVTFQSRTFGQEPSMALEDKQASEARAVKRAEEKRPTLTARKGWSEARKAAENLFDFAGAAAQPTMPCSPSNGSLPGESTGKNSP